MNVCVIPARGGSKRIHKKNIKPFLGKPIIAYSIEAAVNSGLFDRVVVSTDCSEIADISLDWGGEVPFLRDSVLSNDFTGTLPVVQDAIVRLNLDELRDNVCCLYATAPFVTPEVLVDSFNGWIEAGAEYCFSVAKYRSPTQRCFELVGDKRVKMLYPEMFDMRSQDLVDTYYDAGQFYWGKAAAFMQNMVMFSEVSYAYTLSDNLVQDIDTVDDWIRAEKMYSMLMSNMNTD